MREWAWFWEATWEWAMLSRGLHGVQKLCKSGECFLWEGCSTLWEPLRSTPCFELNLSFQAPLLCTVCVIVYFHIACIEIINGKSISKTGFRIGPCVISWLHKRDGCTMCSACLNTGGVSGVYSVNVPRLIWWSIASFFRLGLVSWLALPRLFDWHFPDCWRCVNNRIFAGRLRGMKSFFPPCFLKQDPARPKNRKWSSGKIL